MMNGAFGVLGGIGQIIYILFVLAIAVAVLAGVWKVYEKAGRQGWEGIVPIYNIYVLTQIVGRPWWWLLLCFVPCLNIVVIVLLYMDLAKSFGKDGVYGLGLLFLGFVFFPMLGFGPDRYVGPAAAGQTGFGLPVGPGAPRA
jgi:hypothetical protein